PPTYDSLIAKLIVSGRDRAEVIRRARRALSMFQVTGVRTTIPLHLRVLDAPAFHAGELSTAFLERLLAEPAR
ncbi:MAG: acetyl-CoA carboxylase biotin carboxylase subunit, partial [Acidobacteria bacterium]|nr:acetyl-CoA carboxylase biotin carboxylase subunit [Acidobacteriota bacterium]